MGERDEESLETREEAFARVPSDQRFTWELHPLPGRLLFAETIGTSLSLLKDMFASLNPGGSVVTVLDCGFRENGAFFADLAVLPVESPTQSEPEK